MSADADEPTISATEFRAAVMKTAAGLAHDLGEMQRVNPEQAAKLLSGAYGLIERQLYDYVRHPLTLAPAFETMTAVQLIGSYFACRGDWAAMVRRLNERAKDVL